MPYRATKYRAAGDLPYSGATGNLQLSTLSRDGIGYEAREEVTLEET